MKASKYGPSSGQYGGRAWVEDTKKEGAMRLSGVPHVNIALIVLAVAAYVGTPASAGETVAGVSATAANSHSGTVAQFVGTPPPFVTNLRLSTSIIPAPNSVWIWDDQGSGTLYDAVRGEIDNLTTGTAPMPGGVCNIDGMPWGPGDYTNPCALIDCYATDLTSATFVDVTQPTSGSGLFYLVRAKNSAGIGSYDDAGSSVSHPRDAEINANAQINPCP